MVADGDEVDGDWESERMEFMRYTDHTEAERKAYVIGYQRALLEFSTMLIEHGLGEHEDLVEHFFWHFDRLNEWRIEGDGQPLPLVPKFTPKLSL